MMPKKTTKKRAPAKKNSNKKQTRSYAEKKVANQLVIFGLILVTIASYLTLRHQLVRQERSQLEEFERLERKIESYTLPQITQEVLEQADLNQDGQLDQKDAELIKKAFRETDATSLRADLNADHRVDTKDYSLFVQILKLKAL